MFLIWIKCCNEFYCGPCLVHVCHRPPRSLTSEWPLFLAQTSSRFTHNPQLFESKNICLIAVSTFHSSVFCHFSCRLIGKALNISLPAWWNYRTQCSCSPLCDISSFDVRCVEAGLCCRYASFQMFFQCLFLNVARGLPTAAISCFAV